ncbi:polysaccharide deacetylase family protein [Arthrobacter sp. 24S4-2]|uniref:polysaccharide deacetylase family protein n=1 Tax=Arthrobacter sp. 24S4-2 TaxID=2575374 RepID=UPI0015869CBB|nr:polysaccharide deacetylase family protein [Arthrobacter sp. 24S4-2]
MRHYRRPGAGEFPRRLFLFGSAMTSLSACTVAGGDSRLGEDVPAVALAAAPVPEPQAAEPTSAPIPGRQDIVAEFAGRTPALWGTQLPGTVVRLPEGASGTILTFDCCGGRGGNGVDQALIDTLSRAGAPATFFLNARWIRANPGTAKALAENPLFELGNHGTRHIPLSVTGRSAYGVPGTASAAEVYDEVMANQEVLHSLTGKPARFFRPGTAFLDETAIAIVHRLGLTPVSFSINGDGGATYPPATVFREINASKSGDIIISHANHPGSGTAAGIARALPALQSSGRAPIHFVHEGPGLASLRQAPGARGL